MSTDLVEMTKTMQEQFFGTLTAAQDTFLETFAKMTATAEKYMPAELRPAIKELPIEPKTVIDLGFGFASQLVDAQRSFAERLLAATPKDSGAGAPKAAPVAK
jgi:hypothetical protein